MAEVDEQDTFITGTSMSVEDEKAQRLRANLNAADPEHALLRPADALLGSNAMGDALANVVQEAAQQQEAAARKKTQGIEEGAEEQEALRGEMSELVAAHTTAMASQRQQHEAAQASAAEAARSQASTAKEMARRVESVERDAQAQVEAVQKAHEEKLRTHERQRKEAAERQELERMAQDKVRSELEQAAEAL